LKYITTRKKRSKTETVLSSALEWCYSGPVQHWMYLYRGTSP
jgi:hypothetical protein